MPYLCKVLKPLLFVKYGQMDVDCQTPVTIVFLLSGSTMVQLSIISTNIIILMKTEFL
jgi:hypothetical protein